MFRSRLLIDRRILRTRRTRRSSTTDAPPSSPQDSNNNRKVTIDSNNNFRTTFNNNFDFIEPDDVDVVGDSINSVEIKNWKYHLTNNKF